VIVPDPNMRKAPKKRINQSTALVVAAKESWMGNMRKSITERWNEWGSSAGFMGLFVEKVENIMNVLEKVSSSNLGRTVSKIQQEDPYFTLDGLQDWVKDDLFPKFLKAKQLDTYLSKHTGEAVRRELSGMGNYMNSNLFFLD